MPLKKRGLRVKHCENVASYRNTGGKPSVRAVLDRTVADGWFIQVWKCGRWTALMDLRFVREKDALRAAQSLTAVGLDSHSALMKADPLMVKQLATEHLWW